jgi:prolyl oligopeptidase
VVAAGGRIVVATLENVQSRLRVFDADGRPLRDVRLPEMGSVSDLTGRWESNEVFYTFASFHVPPVITRYDVARDQAEEWFRRRVPVRSGEFELHQVWYSSRDGTRVPMFLLHRKGLVRDGRRPVLLTGYGGFNINMTPAFSELAVVWAERGGVFALPNLRGGAEFGEAWHQAGMLDRKQNVFDDFFAAAEWLIQNGYTDPSRLAIYGTSNGGLLVGAAMTQRPELFAAVVCRYPLLDMLRYHRFLVARYWVSEYGSSDDPEQFRYLYAYSPYHRVRDGVRYPACCSSPETQTRAWILCTRAR